jgi:hypothetical protein
LGLGTRQPRRAVAYHFQNDVDTGPMVYDAIRTRMAAPNHERLPEPPQRPGEASRGKEAYVMDPFNFEGVERETAAVINGVLVRFNEKFGTYVKPLLTGIPFKDE